MATELPDRVLDTAARVAGALTAASTPAEQQVALAMVLAYHCSRHDIDPVTMVGVLVQNVRNLNHDVPLQSRVFERIRNRTGESELTIPVLSEPDIEQYRYNVSDLQRGKVKPVPKFKEV